MENRNNLRKIALLAGAALFSTGALTMPLDTTVTKTETVKYSAPNAVTAEGAAALYQKLQEAAARVCGESDAATTSLYGVDSYGTCVSEALGKAVQQVGSPMVSALYLRGRFGSKLAGTKATTSDEAVASR